MRHLDDRISDLVDGRLDHDARDRALAHITTCEPCRARVEYERFAKTAMRGLSDVFPPPRLLAGLVAIGDPGSPQRPSGAESVADAPVAGLRRRGLPPANRRDSTHPDLAHPRSRRGRGGRRRTVRVMAAGAVSAGALVMVLASLGAQPGSPPPPAVPVSIVPPVDQFTIEHARTTAAIPFAEPASLLIPADSPLADER